VSIDKKVFRTRAVTAIVFAAVMLMGLFTSVWAFIALFFVIMICCLVEYVRLIKKIDAEIYKLYLPLGLPYIVMPVLMMIDLGLGGNLFVHDPANELSLSQLYSPLLPCAVIFSIWINDTMAYIVGSLIGKTPFSKISPKKTWEGTGGGALLCVAVITSLATFIPAAKQVSIQHWIAIAALSAVFGTLGDLLESKLKRMANVKDSGHFMPGHGGFLDRFDSLLIATPFVWLYVKLFI
jgi:phosphatidate cytidylyltransferase